MTIHHFQNGAATPESTSCMPIRYIVNYTVLLKLTWTNEDFLFHLKICCKIIIKIRSEILFAIYIIDKIVSSRFLQVLGNCPSLKFHKRSYVNTCLQNVSTFLANAQCARNHSSARYACVFFHCF